MTCRNRSGCLVLLSVTLLLSRAFCGKVYDVIILGGGIAGVTAARTLEEEGVTNFIIIEARDVIGGRMQSQSFGGYTVELGALWTQGVEENSDNPMYKEVKKYNLDGAYNEFDDLVFYDDQGVDVTAEGLEQFRVAYGAATLMYEHMDKLLDNPARGDISVRAAQRWFGFNPETPVQMVCEYLMYDFEFAYEPNLLSAPYLDWTYDDFGGGDFLVTDSRGYSSLPKSILVDSVPDWQDKVHFETTVTSVDYMNHNTTVTTNKGCFTAKKVILTFSLGVLQNAEVTFKPNLPDWKSEVIHGFLFADYLSVYLKFNEDIPWFVPHDTEWIVYPSQRRGYFPLWQNYNKFLPGSHMLQATVTNNEAKRLQALTDEQVKQEAMSVLRKMFGPDIPDAEDILFSRLHFDPLFHGSYSSWPLGFTAEQHKALRAPVGPVYFAGEAYSQRYYGYTHGAMLSAKETAMEVVACLRDATQCPRPYIPPYAAKGCTYQDAENYDPEAKIDDGSCDKCGKKRNFVVFFYINEDHTFA